MKAQFFSRFRQSSTRAWLWFLSIFIGAIQTILLLFAGDWLSGIVTAFITALVYWTDCLEKEITRRNIEDTQRGILHE